LKFLETQPAAAIEEATEQPQQQTISDLVSEYVFLNNEDEAATKSAEETQTIAAATIVNGEEVADVNGSESEQERVPQNGAEAYENLVKSLTECDADYMKDIGDDQPMDENFGLIDSTMLDSFGFTTRESGLF
jgi:hypothetical protein